MNRTIKDATVRRYDYEGHDQLRQHLDAFVQAYNFARRLKTLKGLTPYEPAFPRCQSLALTVSGNSRKIINKIWAMTGASNGSDVG